jgi:hypothetical protein
MENTTPSRSLSPLEAPGNYILAKYDISFHTSPLRFRSQASSSATS